MEPYIVKTGAEQMQPERIAALLSTTHWAANRPLETIVRSLAGSVCFGVFDAQTDEQVGFARAITDGATTYYLCDVVVDETRRGLGLSRLLLDAVTSYVPFDGLRGILITRTAADLYRKYGFSDYETTFMERHG